MKPTLLILAAGMGSRYGSLKQMDGIGPSGEAILDYSVYDAIAAGFGKVVFVIRGSFADDFRSVFNADRFGGKIEVGYVFQELDKLPDGYSVPDGREKPWGTNHAIMMGHELINEPFAAINADDFYGKDAIAQMGDFLCSVEGQHGKYAMIGYQVSKTLSAFGSVSRGVCRVDGDGFLIDITERTKILEQDGSVVYLEEDCAVPLAPDSPVSMNLFGFTPDYFTHSHEFFKTFLDKNADNLKAEYYIAYMVTHLIQSHQATMKVLPTTSSWFGVTYKEDRPETAANILALIEQGQYPKSLWK